MVNVFVIGCRVRLTVDFQILNADLIPAGVTGVVVSATPEQFAVRLDDRRPALDAWNNEVRLYPGDAPDHHLEAFGWWLFEPMARPE